MYREKTNGANGLAVASNGDLVAVEARGKRVSRTSADKRVVVVTDGAPDSPLLEPNDLILDARGGVYFTDPGPSPVVPGRTRCMCTTSRRAPRSLLCWSDNIVPRPNGIILTL